MIVSCNSILNGLAYFIDVLYICICDIEHREETADVPCQKLSITITPSVYHHGCCVDIIISFAV